MQAASREFDEKLAAVEATLDEVVSGLLPVVDPPPPIPAARDPFDDVLANTADAALLAEAALTESTRVQPAVGSFFHPGTELGREDEAPWWRRGRDAGAA